MNLAHVSPLKIKNIHVPISILCYLACLALPAYYVGARFEPQYAFEALMAGWLGPLDLHFSWYANPLFLLALMYANRPQRSRVLAFIALALAISFLFYKEIAVSEAPTYNNIAAYGWGYGLWVTSIAVLSIGQFLREKGIETRQIAIASLSSCSLLLGGYMAYYFIGNSSIYSIHSERDKEFQERCASSGEQIFRRTTGAHRIYLDPDGELTLCSRRDNPSLKSICGGSVIGLVLLNGGVAYETRDANNPGRYVRYTPANRRGTSTDRLDSEYAVITHSYEIPTRLNISGENITILDLHDNSILATSTFFLERETGRFCGGARNNFSTTALMADVLGLWSEHASAFK